MYDTAKITLQYPLYFQLLAFHRTTTCKTFDLILATVYLF